MNITAYIVPVGFLFFGYLAFRAGFIDLSMTRKAKQWPCVKGKFINVEVKKQINRSANKTRRYVYGIRVKYEYSVNGESYTSNRLTFSDLMRSDLKKVNKRAEALIDLDGVNVFYDPSNPKESVIDPSLATGAIFSLGVGSIFTLFALGCVWFLVKVVSNR